MLTITMSKEYGREVTATKAIKSGSVIELSELLVLSEIDTKLINLTELQYYTFKYDNNRDCLCLGIGELFNHNDTPNVEYTLIEHKGRKVMQFKALKAIKKGEQLFIDYKADSQVETKNYKNKNLVAS